MVLVKTEQRENVLLCSPSLWAVAQRLRPSVCTPARVQALEHVCMWPKSSFLLLL